jgi:hypothetical protein
VTITVPATPAIASLTAAQGTVSVGTAYSLALTGTGGVAPYKWTLASGSGPLPPCVSLSSSGTLSSPAIPTAACAGVYSGIKFTMTDSGTPNALTATSSAQTITVVGPTITFNAMAAVANVGTAFAAFASGAAATGVLGSATYTLNGSLPASGHLAFNSSTGQITGTPYAVDAGTYNFTISVTDQYGDTATSGNLSLRINAPSQAIAFGAAPTLTASDGVKYVSTVSATGGAGALTYTLIGAGSNLPADFTLNASTGAVSGTPSNLNPFTFEVQAADAYGDAPAVQSYTVTVSVGAASKLVFTAEPPANGVAGTPFGAVVQVEDANGFLVSNSTVSVAITSTAAGVTGTTTVSAVNGVATFSNLILDTSGTYTLTATASGLTSAISGNIVISAGTAAKVVFTTQPPSTGTAGTAFGAVVQVQDANGNLVATSNASVSITSTAAGVTGTTTVSAVNGVATFSNLIFNTSGTYTLTAASSGLTSAISGNIVIGAGTAAKLVFSAEPPASGTDGTAFGAAVQVQDANGNLVTNSSVAVTITSTAAGVTGTTTVAAVGGIATFTNLILNTPGTYTLTAASSGLSSAISTGITINLGAASKLVFTTEPPASGTAATPFGAVVQIEDAGGNVITSSNAPVTITSTAAGVTGTTTVAAVNGVATFSNLILNKSGSYTLTASSAGLTPATSTSITIGAGTATQLVFTSEPPSSGAAGTPFGAVVQVQDANGNLVTSSNASVTITSTAAGVTGTTTVAAAGGVATFTNLLLNSMGSYTLTAASAGLSNAISTAISISSGTATKLVFTAEPPANGTAGTAFGAVVTVEDANGNTVTSSNASVTVASTAAGVSGTTTVSAVNGVATFSNLILDTSGTYTLTAASSGLTSAISGNIVIGAGTAAKLVFSAEPPASGTDGTAFGAAVQVQDANGNLVTNSSVAVTITSTAAGVTGTTTVAAVGGIATFTNLILNTPGTYTLTAASSGLSSAISTGITINLGAASKLVFTTEPPASGTAATPFGAVVQIEDAGGNVITSSNAPVTITSTAAGVTGTTTVAAVNGVATFSNLILNKSGSYTLTASSAGLTPATSTSITIGAGTATQLVFTSEPPSSGAAGTPFGAVVQVQDANGNLVTSSNASVTITSTAAGVTGTTTVAAAGGVATFTNLLLNSMGSYTLTAASAGLSNAISTAISISSGTATKLVFTAEPPANGTAGTAFGAVVTVEDANGNTVTSSNASVTVASTAAGVSGTTTVSAVNGVATFTNLLLDTSGTYTLTATASGLTSTVSANIFIGAGTATKLVFSTEPPSTQTPGSSFGAVVQVEDAYGNLVASSGASITMTSTPSGLSGTTAAPASSGIATFSNLILSNSGSYTLTAASSGLASATSSSITITGIGTISGQINLQNNNCNVTTWPTFTVTATNTTTSQTYPTTTDGSGNFTINNLPAGTYTLTPSIPQATSSLFYPANYTGITISNGNNVTGQNFNAVVGYTISGTVSYTGSQFTSQGGQIYMVVNNSCGGTQGNPGTSVAWSSTSSAPSYQIRGVGPGTYTVQAFMDPSSLGQGASNAIDPLGSSSAITVGAGTNGAATGVNLTLTDPTFPTPSSNPTLKVIPMNGGWLLSYNPPLNNYNQEEANQYVVQWAVSTGTDAAGNPTCALSGSSFGAVAGSHSFIATGDKQDVWILNNTSMGTGTFASSTAYCFQVRAYDSVNSTHASGWTSYTDSSGSPEAVASATSTTFCSTNCTTLQGAVTIPSGVSIKPNAPLYIGYFQQSSSGGGPSAIFATEVTNPVSGGAGNSYTLTIPNGTGYVLFGILDQNNDGMIDAYDVTNVRNNNSSGVAFSGGTQSNQNLTLPSANSTASVQTQYSTNNCTGCSATYSINLKVREENKLPVAVALTNTSVATPYVMAPVDLGLCPGCGGSAQFAYYTMLPGGTPSVGDSFDFTVTYSDGSQDTGTVVNGAVTAFGSTGAVVGANDLATNLQTTAGTTPNFTWTFPSSPSSYTYQFNLYQASNCTGNCEIWQIPGQNSSSNGFTYAQTQTGATTGQITWGVDPTGDSSNTPSSSLSSANNYNWSISVQDSNGNSAQANATDNNP